MTINSSNTISLKHLSSDELLKYHRGLFSGEELNRINLHLKECEFCADALKGLSEMNDAMRIYNITHELKKRMKKRIFPKRILFSRFDLLNLMLIFFVIGIILFLAFYFLIAK